MIELKLTSEQVEVITCILEKAYKTTTNIREMELLGEIIGQLNCNNHGYAWCPISTKNKLD